jgi:hypothetical protein
MSARELVQGKVLWYIGQMALPSRRTLAQIIRKSKIGRKLMNSCPSEGIQIALVIAK